MKSIAGQIRLAATDLSNHLGCRHLTFLDLGVARGQRKAPQWLAPDLAIIRELGLRHESAYLRLLQESGITFADLRDIQDEQQSITQTLSAMQKGFDVIAQASLAVGRWFGRADVLRK